MSIENPIKPNIENNILGFEEHENKYLLEDAIAKIDSTLDSAEQEFFEKFDRKPNLFDESDYVSLGEILDLNKKNQEEMKQYKNGSLKPFSPSQYCFRLMRRFLERQDYVPKEKREIFFDAFLGRTEWGQNPKREKDRRLNAIKELTAYNDSFPDDALEKVLKDMEKIYHTCVLNKTYEKDKTALAIGKRIGEHMVNPSAYTLRHLSGISSYSDLAERINRIEYMFEKNLNFVQFK
jgi:hypothetical protein